MKPAAAIILLGLLASCIDPSANCRPVEPARVMLAGKTYALAKPLGARIVGNEGEGDTKVSTRIIGSGKERRNTYCFEGPSNTPEVHAIVFDGKDAASVNNRFVALTPLSLIALRRGRNMRVHDEPGVSGPLPGMTRYDRKGAYDLDAPSIPGWNGRIYGHCSEPSQMNGKSSCRIYAALTSESFLMLDIYGKDIQPERWAEFFTVARDLFASLES